MCVDRSVADETQGLYIWEAPFTLLLLKCCDTLLREIGVPHLIAVDVPRRTEIALRFLDQLASLRADFAVRHADQSYTDDLYRLVQLTFDDVSGTFGNECALYLMDWIQYLFISHESKTVSFCWNTIFSAWHYNKNAYSLDGDAPFWNIETETKINNATAFIFDGDRERSFRSDLETCVNEQSNSVNSSLFYIKQQEIYMNDLNVNEIIDQTRGLFRTCLAWNGLMKELCDREKETVLNWGKRVANELGMGDASAIEEPLFVLRLFRHFREESR
jgi:hypothetical protein